MAVVFLTTASAAWPNHGMINQCSIPTRLAVYANYAAVTYLDVWIFSEKSRRRK